MMNLYVISQDKNVDYDTWDSAVVAAKSEAAARLIHPSDIKTARFTQGWTSPKNVKVCYIGRAKRGLKAGLILGSFNAG